MQEQQVDANVFDYNGKRYTLAKLDAAELVRAAEDHFRAERLAPIDAILPELAKLKDFPEAQKRLVELAYPDLRSKKRKVSREEIAAWLDTRDGVVFLLWYQINKNHPEVTLEQADTMFINRAVEELVKQRDAANRTLTQKIIGENNERPVSSDSSRDAMAPG